MDISKKEIGKFLLVNVVIPVVLSLIVAFAFDRIKAKSEAKAKLASQPPKKVPVVTTTPEEEVEVATTEI